MPSIPSVRLPFQPTNPPINTPTTTVFHDLLAENDPTHSGWELLYGGTLRQPFDPSAVFISPRTGRLYHTLAWGGAGRGKESRPRFGLLRSHLGLVLMDHIHYEGVEPLIEWGTRRYPIRPLPEQEEPVWGLPPMPHEA